MLGNCWPNHQRFCPGCGSRKLYKLKDGRRRCPRCNYTFHDFSRRWINTGALSSRQWIRVLKLFELELPTKQIAYQTELAYDTAYKAVTAIRLAILARAHDADHFWGGEFGIDHGCGRRKGTREQIGIPQNKIPIFGILEQMDSVRVEVLPSFTPQALFDLSVKKVRKGNIVYTDRVDAYDAFIFCGVGRAVTARRGRFAKGGVYIDRLGGFWNYAREHLRKHHGLSPSRFPLYLKEMEFRYNHRHEDIFPLLAKYVCEFVPKHME